ncbi:MAG: glycosyltransferase family 2 protein [Oscillospiraceae bacterium]
MPKLSIVIPVYFNEDNLRPLYADIERKVLDVADFGCEIIFVDDGSSDGSWAVIEELCNRNSNVRGVKLSRNFGSHAAILCGLSESTGECAVVKAADLQEPTELILEMYEMWKRGNNVVLAVRDGRNDGAKNNFFANLYYKITRKFALPNMPEAGFDVYLLDRKVIEVLERMDERNSALTGQILWSGFKTAEVYYTRAEREIGKSRWTLRKKMRLVSDTFFSFTAVPITFVSAVGAISCAGSILWAFFVLANKIFGKIPVEGFTTLFIFQLFSFGIMMLTLGVLGNYLWRSFDASRERPVYIVEDRCDESERRRDAKVNEKNPDESQLSESEHTVAQIRRATLKAKLKNKGGRATVITARMKHVQPK